MPKIIESRIAVPGPPGADGATNLTDANINAAATTLNAGINRLDSMVINVKHPTYGATGNGTTDDTTAIQNAINAAASTAGVFTGGKTVLIPAGVYLVTSIILKHLVTLQGTGRGTILKHAPAATTGMVRITDTTVQQTQLRDMILWGNKAASTAGTTTTKHGLHYLNGDGTQTPKLGSDPYQVINNVWAWECKGAGMRIDGRGEGIYSNLVARDCDGIGFDIQTVDSRWMNLSAGNCGAQGILVAGGNNTITNAKAFYNGRILPASGHGFHITASNNTLNAVEAQDNDFHGFFLDTVANIAISGIHADSNSAGHYDAVDRSASGVEIYNSADIQIDGLSWDRNANPRRQKYGLGLSGGSTRVKADLTFKSNTVRRVRMDSGSVEGNYVSVPKAMRSYASPTITPDPWLGALTFCYMTANTTINAPLESHAGMELTLSFEQDAAPGTRTVTWNSVFKGVGAWQPATGAYMFSSISFIFDGTQWIKTGAS